MKLITLLLLNISSGDWSNEEIFNFKKDCYLAAEKSNLYPDDKDYTLLDVQNNAFSKKSKACKCLLHHFQKKYEKYDINKVWKSKANDKDTAVLNCVK